MKIIQMTSDFRLHGTVGSYVHRLSNSLMDAGHQVAVIYGDVHRVSQGKMSEYLVENFYRFHHERAQMKTDEVLGILEREKPDIVHLHGNENYYLEDELRARYPLIKVMHTYEFCPSRNKFHHAGKKICSERTTVKCRMHMIFRRCTLRYRPSAWNAFYDRSIAAIQNDKSYSKILVHSDYVKKQAIASGYREDQLEVIPYFVSPMNEGEKQKTYEKQILFCGNLVKEKGIDYLLKAMTKLPKSLKCMLRIVGTGPELDRAKDLAKKYKIRHRVKFVGGSDGKEKERLFRSASIFVMPSLWPEPFGVDGVEAMKYGKPVVAFDVGGICEWLEDGKTGYLVEPKSVDALASKIEALLNDVSLIEKMGVACQQKVANLYSAEQHIEKLVNVYQQVIEEARRNLQGRKN